ncbi:MAG: hypothetical protein FWE13_01015 [Firmicutes bacterium]|nr:hypothetical protein [Bacillota bacterium]
MQPYNQENNQPLEQYSEYIKQNSFSLKSSSLFSILANIFVGIILIGGFVGLFFVFDLFSIQNDTVHENFVNYMLLALGGIGIGLAVMLIGMLFRLIILKSFGGGKCGLLLGLIIEITYENPISKTIYLVGDLFFLIALIAVILLSVFFWNPLTYLALVFLVLLVAPNIFIWMFIIRQPKGSVFKLENGELNSYIINKNYNEM